MSDRYDLARGASVVIADREPFVGCSPFWARMNEGASDRFQRVLPRRTARTPAGCGIR
jgi:hypothetical protein